MTTPRIYVASLSDYNAGRLHGAWIDVSDADTMREAISEMLKRSPEPDAEEYAIHDYEGFGDYRLSESESLDTIAELAELIEEHGELFTALLAHLGSDDLDYAKRVMEDGYRGEFDSLKDYAESFVEECYGDSLENLPDLIRHNIDWDGIAHDFELGGDIFTVETGGKVHVFDNAI